MLRTEHFLLPTARAAHTGRKALLQLVGLVGVLEHQRVQVALAPDLELGQASLLALLDPGIC